MFFQPKLLCMDTSLPEWGITEAEASDPNIFSVNTKDKANKLGIGANGAVFKARFHGAQVAAKTLFILRDPETYFATNDQVITPLWFTF